MSIIEEAFSAAMEATPPPRVAKGKRTIIAPALHEDPVGALFAALVRINPHVFYRGKRAGKGWDRVLPPNFRDAEHKVTLRGFGYNIDRQVQDEVIEAGLLSKAEFTESDAETGIRTKGDRILDSRPAAPRADKSTHPFNGCQFPQPFVTGTRYNPS